MSVNGYLILVIVILILIIVIQFLLLVRKSKKKYTENMKRTLKREEAEEVIKEKWIGKERELNEKIKQADNAKDFLDIIAGK